MLIRKFVHKASKQCPTGPALGDPNHNNANLKVHAIDSIKRGGCDAEAAVSDKRVRKKDTLPIGWIEQPTSPLRVARSTTELNGLTIVQEFYRHVRILWEYLLRRYAQYYIIHRRNHKCTPGI